jgi:polyisoprenoid-binding protein YceI
MRKLLVLVALLSMCLPCSAFEAEKFVVDTSHSKVKFTAPLIGVIDVEGTFTDIDAVIMYDEVDLTKSSVTAIIQAASINTSDSDRDRDLRSPEFFDVKKFPTLRFQSKHIEKRGENYVMLGSLTIRDVTRDVEIPLVWRQKKALDIWQNHRIAFDGQLAINRKDYGVAGPAFWNNAISNAITIGLKITAEIPNYAEWGYPAPQGKQAVGSVIGDVVHKEGAEAALQRYRYLEKDPAHYEFSAKQLTILGRKLVEEGKLPEAVAILKFNTERYPDNAKAYEILGDAELAVHDRVGAIAAYKRSLQLQPDNPGAIESLRALRLAAQ